MEFAVRVNSFLRENISVVEAIDKMAEIEGITHIDLNYPEHFKGLSKNTVSEALKRNNLKLNALAIRFRDEFINGAFGNKNEDIHNKAIQICKEAIDICKELSGSQVIIWLGYDGYDYPFQIEYMSYWNQVADAFREVCDYSTVPISIEYKPYEERAHALLDSLGTTLMMIGDVGKDNLGVTIDFCHLLMKKENPSFSAAYLLQRKKLFSIHLNDGEGSSDDGLMTGTISPIKLLELLYYLKKYNYEGVVFFDTFPKREGAVEECKANINMCRKMEHVLDTIGMDKIGAVIASGDATEISRLISDMFI